MKYWYMPLVLLLVACPPKDGPQPTPDVVDTDLCDEAELRLEELQCTDPKGNPMWINQRGVPFREICRAAQEDGNIFLDPRCISEAKDCEEAKSCPTRNH